jgi:hypothetical protein
MASRYILVWKYNYTLQWWMAHMVQPKHRQVYLKSRIRELVVVPNYGVGWSEFIWTDILRRRCHKITGTPHRQVVTEKHYDPYFSKTQVQRHRTFQRRLITWRNYKMQIINLINISFIRRSQWPRGLRRKSTAARLLRSRVQIPSAAWVFVVCVVR